MNSFEDQKLEDNSIIWVLMIVTFESKNLMLNPPNLSLASKLGKLFVLSVAICRTLNNYTCLKTVQKQLTESKTIECQLLQNLKLAKTASVLHLESSFSWLTCLRKNNSCSCSLYQHSLEPQRYFSLSLLQGMNPMYLKWPQKPTFPEMKNIDQPL